MMIPQHALIRGRGGRNMVVPNASFLTNSRDHLTPFRTMALIQYLHSTHQVAAPPTLLETLKYQRSSKEGKEREVKDNPLPSQQLIPSTSIVPVLVYKTRSPQTVPRRPTLTCFSCQPSAPMARPPRGELALLA